MSGLYSCIRPIPVKHFSFFFQYPIISRTSRDFDNLHALKVLYDSYNA